MSFFECNKRLCSRRCDEYECSCCPELKFSNSHSPIKHLKNEPHEEQGQEFWCSVCEERLVTKLDYIYHLKKNRVHKYDLHQAACCGRFQDVGQLIYTEEADVTGASHRVKSGDLSCHLGITPVHCAAFMGYSR